MQKLEQSHSLTMTTSMHQSIKILQMSSAELDEFSASELGKNPFLEDKNVSVEEKPKKKEAKEQSNFDQTSAKMSSVSHHNFLENIAYSLTLKEYISEQINITFHDNKELLIANYLLDYLQPSGYLNIDLEEVVKNLKCSMELVNAILAKMQSFDPPGIFARNLRECLILQLKDQGSVNPALLKMVENIDLIPRGDFKKLSKLCSVNIADLSELIKQIKGLNPKPGNGFLVEDTRFRIPDVILTFTDSNELRLEINEQTIPKLRVNYEYYTRVREHLHSKDEKEFVKSELDSANVIVRAVEQRASTIIKVAKAIVEEQIDFFTKGVMHLKPMTLNKIAALTGFNESTISRSTANKYISAPNGIYELKYFFSSGLANTRAVGDNISSTKVKEIIRQLILAEDCENVLSDDEIAAQLAKFNISIARRTVAKYRESMDIKTSASRKRQKLLVNV